MTLPVTSVTHATVVVPPQLSPALTAEVDTSGTAALHVTVVAAGHEIVGATLSFTTIV